MWAICSFRLTSAFAAFAAALSFLIVCAIGTVGCAGHGGSAASTRPAATQALTAEQSNRLGAIVGDAVARANQLVVDEKPEAAIALAEQKLAEVRRTLSEAGLKSDAGEVSLANMLRELAGLYLRHEEFDRSRRMWGEVIAVETQLWSAQDWSVRNARRRRADVDRVRRLSAADRAALTKAYWRLRQVEVDQNIDPLCDLLLHATQVRDTFSRLLGARHADTATAIKTVALLHTRADDYDAAEEEMGLALGIYREVCGEDSADYTDCQMRWAGVMNEHWNAAASACDFGTAHSIATKLIDLLEHTRDVAPSTMGGARRLLAAAEKLQGMTFAQIQQYVSASYWRNETDRLRNAERHDEALHAAHDARMAYEETLGPLLVEYFEAMRTEAYLLWASDPQQALDLLSRSFTLQSQSMGADDPSYGRAWAQYMSDRSKGAFRDGLFDEALDEARQAASVFYRLNGESSYTAWRWVDFIDRSKDLSPELRKELADASQHENEAALADSRQDYDVAQAELRKALKARKHVVDWVAAGPTTAPTTAPTTGPVDRRQFDRAVDDAGIAFVIENLARVHARSGDLKTAVAETREALALRLGAGEADHPQTRDCRRQLVRFLEELAAKAYNDQDFDSAESAAREMVEASAEMNPPQEAPAHLREIITLVERRRAMGADQLKELKESDRLIRAASEHAHAREVDDAIDEAGQAIQIRRRLMGPRWIEQARLLSALGDMLIAEKREPEAAAALRESAAVFLALAGRRDQGYLTAVKRLENVLSRLASAAQHRDDWAAAAAAEDERGPCQVLLHGEASNEALDCRLRAANDRRMAALTSEQRAKLDEARSRGAEARLISDPKDPRVLLRVAQMLAESSEAEIKILGENDQTAMLLAESAERYRAAGADSLADEADARALAIRRRVFEDAHPQVLLSRIGQLERKMAAARQHGDYGVAAELGRSVVWLRLRDAGRGYWRYNAAVYELIYTRFLATLAVTDRQALLEAPKELDESDRLLEEGRIPEATERAEHARKTVASVAGVNSLTYAEALFRQARSLRSNLAESRAEDALLTSKELYTRWLGRDCPQAAIVLIDLGEVYASLSDPRRAVTAMIDAVETCSAILRDDQHTLENIEAFVQQLTAIQAVIPIILWELDTARGDRRDYLEDELRWLRSVWSVVEAWASPGSGTSALVDDLNATYYAHFKQWDLAETHRRRAMETVARIDGPESAQYARRVTQLGGTQLLKGDYEAAVKTLQGALTMMSRLPAEQGSGARLTVTALKLLSFAQQAAGQSDEAYGTTLRALELVDRVDARLSVAASASDLETILPQLDTPLRQLVGQAAGGRAVSTGPRVEETLEWALRNKSANLAVLTRTHELIREQAADPAVGVAVRKLRGLRQSLASLAVAPPAFASDADVRNLTGDLDREIRTVEASLAALLRARHPEPPARATVADARSRLPAGAALIEIVGGIVPDPQQPDRSKWRYFAFVLSHDAARPATLLDLGDADAVDEVVKPVIDGLRGFNPAVDDEKVREADFRRSSAALYEVLFVKSKLAEAIGADRTLLIAPDGELHRVPFEALVTSAGEGGKYLVEEGFRIAYLSSGRDLFRPASKAGQGTVVFADPEFAEPAAERVAVATRVLRDQQAKQQVVMRGVHAEGLRGEKFEDLPGTGAEAAEVERALGGSVFGPVTPFVRKEALRDVFLVTRSPRILHVATHGFFKATPAASSAGAALEVRDRGGIVLAQNPLLRSGLVLAGANAGGVGVAGDDGIVTAEEICLMNLQGTELVVLSACESGLGDIRTGQGVYGLRWAFLNAGARSMITSLCKVSDTGTQAWMGRFYAALKAGKSKLEAFHETQLGVIEARRAAGGAAHPFYWASFVLAGEP